MKDFFLKAPYFKISLGVFFLIAVIIILTPRFQPTETSEPIRIGVLHSMTGALALSEKPLVEAIQLAIEEINEKGGLLGRKLVMILADGKSEPSVFASEAKRLIEKENVSVLFGCWTSECRQAVKPVVEAHHHLMFYALRYEGLEESPNIIYTGATPSQQVIPATNWALNNLGKKSYLIGSNYLFPHIVNIMIKDVIKSNDGLVLAEKYFNIGDKIPLKMIDDIKKSKPDVIFNSLKGQDNAQLFSLLMQNNLSDIPIFSFGVSEIEILPWKGNLLKNHYAVWSYFQSLENDNNKAFVSLFKKRFGQEKIINDPMEASYTGVHLWAQAVENKNTPDPKIVNSAGLLRQTYSSPGGIAAIDSITRHKWKWLRIGKLRPDGQFDIITNSRLALHPNPWPMYRSREEWLNLVSQFGLGAK